MNYGTTEIFLIVIVFGLLFVPPIFFLRTLQNTLKEIHIENRKMQPGAVWLVLIPLFGFVWQFIVISRMADSLKIEFARRNITLDEKRPAYSIGLSYCILCCCSIIPLVGSLAKIAGLVCWIIYWIKIKDYKSRLQQNASL
jgi:hypothetical protein